MTTKNDITQDSIISKTATDNYRKNYDHIFNKEGKKIRYVLYSVRIFKEDENKSIISGVFSSLEKAKSYAKKFWCWEHEITPVITGYCQYR